MKRAETGMTLIEVLVSIGLLGMILAAIMAIVPGMTRQQGQVTAQTQMNMVTRGYFEDVRTQWSGVATGSNDPFMQPAPQIDSARLAPQSQCQTPVVTNLISRDNPQNAAAQQVILRRVTLTCTVWDTTRTFSTDISREGI